MTGFGNASVKMEGGIADPDEFTWECDCEKCQAKYKKWKAAYDDKGKGEHMTGFQSKQAAAQAKLTEDDDTQDYKKPWVSLTDEEIWSVVSRIGTADSNVNPLMVLKDARAIEQALKERNT